MKKSNLKITPISLALLGGLSLIPTSQAANSPKESVEKTDTTQTYTYTANDSDTGTHYLEKVIDYSTMDDNGQPIKTIINIDDPNLDLEKALAEDDSNSGLKVEIIGDPDKYSTPIEAEVNIKQLKGSYTESNGLTKGVSISTSVFGEANSNTAINTKVNVTGNEERAITAIANNKGAALLFKQPQALDASYYVNGNHELVFDAPNTTYLARALHGEQVEAKGISTSTVEGNGNFDLKFKSGKVNVTGFSAIGIDTQANNSSVNVKLSGGTITAVGYGGTHNLGKTIGIDNRVSSSVADSSITIDGGVINATAGAKSHSVWGVNTYQGSSTSPEKLAEQNRTITQNGGEINIDASGVIDDTNSNHSAYGIISLITSTSNVTSRIVQNGGSISVSNTKNSNSPSAGICNISNQNVEVTQGVAGRIEVTGKNNAAIKADSKDENITIDLSGYNKADTYGIYATTAENQLSTININGTVIADTAVFNNDGDSLITITKDATIGSDNQKARFDLNRGDDKLTFSGTNLENIGEINGGQDSYVGSDFDTLTFKEYSTLDLDSRLVNWERINLQSGIYNITENLRVGRNGHDEKTGGIGIANDATLNFNNNISLNGDLHNKGAINLNSEVSISGEINNFGLTNINSSINLSSYLNNKAGATANINADYSGRLHNALSAVVNVDGNLSGNIENSGKINLNNHSTVTGDVSNMGMINLNNTSQVDSDVYNYGTININDEGLYNGNITNLGTTNLIGNGIRVRGNLDNYGIVNAWNGDLDHTLQNNKGAYVNLFGPLSVDLNNEGQTTFYDNSTLNGTLYNRNASITIFKDQTAVRGEVQNEGTVSVKGNTTITQGFNNKENATLIVSSTLNTDLDNKGTTTLVDRSNFRGTINNDHILNLENGSTVTGILNNKAGSNLTLKQVTVNGELNNEGDITVVANAAVTNLNNRSNLTFNTNSSIRGTVNNETDLTLDNNASIIGTLNNKAGATTTINQGSIVGELNNESSATLNSGATVNGAINNKANGVTTLNNNVTVNGTLTNEGTTTIAGQTTISEGLTNKENANIRVNATLVANLLNQGTATLNSGANLTGKLNNEHEVTFEEGATLNGILNNSNNALATLNNGLINGSVNNNGTVTLNNGSTVHGQVENKANATLNLNQANITSFVENKGTINVTQESTIDNGLRSQAGATVNINSTLNSEFNNYGTVNLNTNALLGKELINSGTANINGNSTAIKGISNNGSGTLNVNAELTGNVKNHSKANLNDGSVIRGTFSNGGRVTLTGNTRVTNNLNNLAHGTVNMGGNFTGDVNNEGKVNLANGLNLVGALNNNGTTLVVGDATVGSLTNSNLVDLRSTTPDQFNTLTVEGDLTGDGLIKFNAKIAGDTDTLHDTLHVKGDVHGTTTIEITNLGEAKDARELKQGVRIVELEDSSVVDQDKDAFKLLDAVEAGAYEYNTLAYKTATGAKGFYLVSKPTTGTDQRGDDSTIIDKDGNPVYQFRKGTAAYILNQQINAQALADLTTNLHQREGEQRAETNYLNPNQSWVRYLGNQDELTAHNLGAKTTNFGVQVGYDFRTSHNHESGLRNRTGIYAAYNKVDSTLTDSYRKEFYIPGRIDTNLGSLALYHTATLGNGYLDLVGGLHFFHNDYAIINGGEQNAFGGNLSAEAGYNLDLGNHFFVEPQVQLSYQGTRYAGFKDAVTTVKGYTHQSLRPRVGFRLGYHDLAGTNFWLHANLETELLKTAKLTIGQDIVSINRAAKTTYDLGLNGQVALSPTTVLYGSAQYQGSLNKATTLANGAKVKTTKLHSFGAEAGLRFTW